MNEMSLMVIREHRKRGTKLGLGHDPMAANRVDKPEDRSSARQSRIKGQGPMRIPLRVAQGVGHRVVHRHKVITTSSRHALPRACERGIAFSGAREKLQGAPKVMLSRLR